ncbi:hypothetical protein AMAG_13841 [Allomyces macrogynus ATCC 38327]|uniref:Multifunctional methyltransferase subunit TRM112 n=1 Tax=Allomyces macrogynus (strain ATCC 38327) TaxID=578462 RepID=A0A0L0T2L8_ALLM3|nr:hypothetical protein GGF31_001969 [Allomyces arbusculus]KNE68966.1 hypothetical protein AMAG_13841 [Allomyces macrogynus ATCC 38327]|eukprot:KNE68966.1 hypothetical protein AMAG_13841 [Allomyces macrogynus ATCC 38327]
MVRLLTHNMLQCHVKNCTNGFPLRFQDPVIEQHEQEINKEFLVNMLPRIDWNALRTTVDQLGLPELPAAVPENPAEDEAFLAALHRALMEVNIQSGSMVCPECEHVYPIRDGIPNMLLSEDEV